MELSPKLTGKKPAAGLSSCYESRYESCHESCHFNWPVIQPRIALNMQLNNGF